MKTKGIKITLTEEIIRGLFRGGIHPVEFATSLNNVFFHGEIFNEVGVQFDQKALSQLYEGIGLVQKAAKRMQ